MMIRTALAVSLVFATALPARAACPTPAFQEMLPAIAAGHAVSDFAFGDLDDDGDLDLVTVSSAVPQFGVNVHINEDGDFLAPFAVAGDQPANVALADMNNDGRMDIVIIEQRTDEGCHTFGSCSSLQVLFADEEGGFAAAGDHRVLSFVESVRRIITADFDKNGHMDVLMATVVFDDRDPEINIAWGGPSGTRLNGAIQGLRTHGRVGDVAVGDFNSDTFLDIAAAVGKTDQSASSRVFLWRNNIPFNQPTNPFTFDPITASGAVHSHDENLRLVTGHFNKDANLDVAVVMETAKLPNMPATDFNVSGVHILLGDGTAATLKALADGGAAARGPDRFVDLATGDVDEDGDIDVTVVGTKRVFFTNSGTGTLSTEQFPANAGSASRIVGFDFDEDGRDDLAYANGTNVHILLNSCDRRFVSMTHSASPSPSTYGGNVTFTASLTVKPDAPAPTGTVWFAAGGNALGSATVNAAGNASLTVKDLPIGTHTVTASYSSSNGFAGPSVDVTHTVNRPPFGAPLSVTATGFAGPNAVVIRWVSTADVSTHEILRRDDLGQWQTVGSTAAEQFTDSAVDPTRAYVYTVRSVHATNGTRSANGNLDLATTMNQARPTDKIIRAADTTDVRSLAQSLRRSAGLGAFTFTDATLAGVRVKAVHLTELRTAIAQARAALGLPPVALTQPTITPGVTKVKFNDLQELRTSFN